jgi:RNA polymerase-binding transcription factor DksA
VPDVSIPDKVEIMLTPKQVERLTTLIGEREQELRAAMQHAIQQRLGRDISDLEASGGDDSEQSIADLLESVDTHALDSEVEELLAIESAKSAIGNKTYGQCIDCQEAIGFQRLLAMPAAPRCHRCQERHEREHWQAGDATL